MNLEQQIRAAAVNAAAYYIGNTAGDPKEIIAVADLLIPYITHGATDGTPASGRNSTQEGQAPAAQDPEIEAAAMDIATRAHAATKRSEVTFLHKEAEARGVTSFLVKAGTSRMPLEEYLRTCWKALPVEEFSVPTVVHAGDTPDTSITPDRAAIRSELGL